MKRCDWPHAQVIEAPSLKLQIAGDVPQVFMAGEFGASVWPETGSSVVYTKFLSLVMACGQLAKFMSADMCKQLNRDSISMGHGSGRLGSYHFPKNQYAIGEPSGLLLLITYETAVRKDI